MDKAWMERVRLALMAEDDTQLAALFQQAEQAEGHEAASRSWLAVVSAFDADAETG